MGISCTGIQSRHLFFFRPIPDREYVVNYINAFYLTESELEMWLKEHQVMIYLSWVDGLTHLVIFIDSIAKEIVSIASWLPCLVECSECMGS